MDHKRNRMFLKENDSNTNYIDEKYNDVENPAETQERSNTETAIMIIPNFY